jgi:hypothetical protein
MFAGPPAGPFLVRFLLPSPDSRPILTTSLRTSSSRGHSPAMSDASNSRMHGTLWHTRCSAGIAASIDDRLFNHDVTWSPAHRYTFV